MSLPMSLPISLNTSRPFQSLFLNQCTSASPNEARLLDELLGRSDDTFVHVRPAV